MVGWSNCRERGMIGAMKQCSFQSRLVKLFFYFAQELVSLSRGHAHTVRLLVGIVSSPLSRKMKQCWYFPPQEDTKTVSFASFSTIYPLPILLTSPRCVSRGYDITRGFLCL